MVASVPAAMLDDIPVTSSRSRGHRLRRIGPWAEGKGATMAFSVGIGLTNECNLRCAHCYRPDMVRQQLTRGDVRRVCDAVTASSMNLGVGENGLHPEYLGI